MKESVKFSSKIERDVLDALREHASASGRTLASVLTEAGREYLERAAVRPAFRTAVDSVFDQHRELLERLAK